MLTEGSVIASKYRLDGMFARGGMGSVWRARHLLLDTDVAIKLMDPSIAASPPERARFAAEAKAAAKLKSRHIVQVHDYGVESDTPYIVMELLEGEDLGARLRREGRLSLQAAAELLGQLARGLRRAHEMGVIHRDLKPANVFLARADDEEVAKILDFGIARFTARSTTSEMTRTGTLLGSPPYMSPEQVRGLRELDYRTDLWSVGVILFRCVTGALPFHSEQIGDLIFKICADPVPAASSLAADIPASLDRFFERALAKNPAARFQSITEMVDAFSPACGLSGRAPLSSLAESTPGLEAAARAAMAERSADATAVFPGHLPNRTLPLDLGVAAAAAFAGPASGRRIPRTELAAPSPGALRSTDGGTGSGSTPNLGQAAPLASEGRRGTGTQIARPVGAALVPAVPHEVSSTMPFADAGTLSTGGRTLRSGPANRVRQGLWWRIGLLGGAALVAVGVVISQVRNAGKPGNEEANPLPPSASSMVVLPSAQLTVSGAGATAVAPSPSVPTTVAADPEPSSTSDSTTDPGASASSVAVKKSDAPGKLTVNAIPVSKVVVDGRPMGSTPLVGFSVSAGKHRVTLVNPQTGTRYSESVEVAPGGSGKVVHRF